eukprot:TRINITY_DN7212_c0_g1_i1.p1 TRINITY_DN7212_c0_g1~~TRINITY_DN7212_c0_g1_i1.p1  ORF type:complete len:262 (+),score=47.38 TRINITY_DN7212_c0_g1_i1:633-1418(+)
MAAQGQGKNSTSNFFAVLGVGLGLIGGANFVTAYFTKEQRNKIVATPFSSVNDVLNRVEMGSSPIGPIKLQGRIGTDVPIQCEIAHERGAIYEKKTTGMWYSWADKSSNSEYVENVFRRGSKFYIHGGNPANRIYIQIPNNSNLPTLEQVHSHEEPGGNFLLSSFLSLFRVRYPYKYIISESILPLDRNLFVLGNVTKSRDGVIQLTMPKAWERKGIMTLQSEDEVIEEMETSILNQCITGTLLTGLGVASLITAFMSRNQ